jgi:uncharacterized membrane protein required for colicin V production
VTWIDFLVAGLCLLMVLSGLIRGHVRTFFETVFLVAAFLGASLAYGPVSDTLLPSDLLWLDWGRAFTFVFLFFTLNIAGNILTAWIAGRKPARGYAVFLGGVFGAVKGALLSMMIVATLLAAPAPARSAIVRDVRQSPIAGPAMESQIRFYDLVAPLVPIPVPRLGTGKDVF